MNLEDKLLITFHRFSDIFEKDLKLEEIFVAWSGGKDSTVVLYLWKKFLEQKINFTGKVNALSIDTGLKFKEVIEHRDNLAELFNVNLFVIRPQINLDGYPVAKDPVACCKDLKITPLKKFIGENKVKILITGLRADENPVRKTSPLEVRSEPSYIQLNPILHWSEMDIWTYHVLEGIPHCVLYEKGYRSLGCRPCTKPAFESERDGRNRKKEESMEILRSLGYF